MIGKSVFISATTKGLGVWRDHIAEILRNHGIAPLFQADFTPESIIVQNEIRKLIKTSTGVICLVGPYFGSPLAARGTGEQELECKPTFSYTQYEWQLAMDWGKPIKTYVFPDEFFGKIESEESKKFDCSHCFRDWQCEFRKRVKDRGPYLTMETELKFALALAKTNWERWINE